MGLLLRSTFLHIHWYLVRSTIMHRWLHAERKGITVKHWKV